MKFRTLTKIALCLAAALLIVSSVRRLSADTLVQRLAEAQRRGDETAVRQIASEAAAALGARAGIPEVDDAFVPIPAEAQLLTADEARGAFKPMLKLLPRYKWYKIGLDPTSTPHLPREAATILSGCVSAKRAGLEGADQALAEAKEAADYLLWTQRQGGAGCFPFPFLRGGPGKAFESATRFLDRAKADGTIGRIVKNDWVIDDLGYGGLQFDNGLCGLAVLELYELTHDPKYLDAAVAAAEWAAARPVCTNWNYNSFSVHLLARVGKVTGRQEYVDAAALKARLGVYPGQLTDGQRKGRWADPHNARPAYHYIMLRGIAALAAALPHDSRDRKLAIDCLQLGLTARNPDFLTRGAPVKDSAIEALLLIDSTKLTGEVLDARVRETLAAIERLITAEYRKGKNPLSPGNWAAFLEWKLAREQGH